MVREIKWPSNEPLGVQWKKWMECTIILDPKYAKLEKTIESIVVVSNGVLAWVYVPETGLYSGFTFGASHGWSVGRWIAQKVTSLCSKKKDPSPSDIEIETVKGLNNSGFKEISTIPIEELV